MALRNTTSEFQPAPPFYRNASGGSHFNNQIAVVNQATSLQAPSAFRQTDGNGNRINSAGVALPLNGNLQQKAVVTFVNPTT